MKGSTLKLKRLRRRQWTDKDEVLIHAMFEVLCQFVDEELRDNTVDWDETIELQTAWMEIQFLYKWWQIRSERHKKNPANNPNISVPSMRTFKDEHGLNIMDSSEWNNPEYLKLCKDVAKFDKDCRQEDDEMMHRLITVRSFMWT